jgi:F-type H+-transporting ATPase subunit alpha
VPANKWLKAVNAGLLDDLPVDQVSDAEASIQQAALDQLPELCSRMEAGEKLDDSLWQQVLDVAGEALSKLKQNPHQ